MPFIKAFYFLYFAAAAGLLPFLALYYQSVGLPGRQIGLLAGLLPVLTLVGAPLWGGLADATRRHKALLLAAIAGTLLSALALSRTGTFLGLVPVVAALALFMAPIMPLVDNSAVEQLGKRPEQYGKLRLWGALGWGLAAPAMGALVDRAGLPWAFYSFSLLMFGGVFLAVWLPGGRAALSPRFWTGLHLLVAERKWLPFSAAVLVGGMGLALITNYLFLYFGDLGASKGLMGLSLTVATLSELPVFFYSDRLLARWGARGLLSIALLASALRLLAYSLIGSPWLALPLQLLHGLTFAGMWVAGVAYAAELAPPGMGATAQALFSSLLYGLGGALGALAGGALYEAYGAGGMYRWAGAGLLAVLLLFLPAGRARGMGKERVESGKTRPR